MKKILVVGSLNMDMVTKVAETPKVGETVSGDGLELIPGGKGANQAVALAKLGANVEMVGLLGQDANGRILKENLCKMGVENKCVKMLENVPTGLALIMVNASGDNSIVVIPGANGEIGPDNVKAEWFEGVDYVLCQLEIPVETVEQVLRMAKEVGAKTILNPAPARRLSRNLLSLVDILIPNQTEFELLTEIKISVKEDLIRGYQYLNTLGIKELIVTLGEKGALYYNGKDFIEVAAKTVKVVDTTAAGDSFIAGVCDSLARGLSMLQALEMGTKLAAITVTRFGAQSSLPTRYEIG